MSNKFEYVSEGLKFIEERVSCGVGFHKGKGENSVSIPFLFVSPLINDLINELTLHLDHSLLS